MQSNNHDMKIEFLSNISHEVKTPMNAIVGFAELLQKSNLTPEQQNYVDVILNNSNQLLYLLNDVLDSSKMRLGHLSLHNEIVNLQLMIDDIQSVFLQKSKEKNLSFKIDKTYSDDYNIDIDVKRVSQIINSLLDNSFKFTKIGFVHLTIAIKKIDNESIDIAFIISDSGIGIEKSKLKHIFDLFTQEDSSDTREFGGIGLGLSMSYELAKMMNGTLSAESQKDEGSTFTFSLYNVKTINLSSDNYSNYTSNFQLQSDEKIASDLQMSAESLLELDKFLAVIEREFISEYHEIVAQQNFDSYEIWAKKLLALAKTYHNSVIIDYVDELLDCLNRFDIENLNKILTKFLTLIENMNNMKNMNKEF